MLRFCVLRLCVTMLSFPSGRAKVRPEISATQAAFGADEAHLEIREPGLIRPLIDPFRRKLRQVAALVIAAARQEPARSIFAHLLPPHPP
jgi:hypothetical protein